MRRFSRHRRVRLAASISTVLALRVRLCRLFTIAVTVAIAVFFRVAIGFLVAFFAAFVVADRLATKQLAQRLGPLAATEVLVHDNDLPRLKLTLPSQPVDALDISDGQAVALADLLQRLARLTLVLDAPPPAQRLDQLEKLIAAGRHHAHPRRVHQHHLRGVKVRVHPQIQHHLGRQRRLWIEVIPAQQIRFLHLEVVRNGPDRVARDHAIKNPLLARHRQPLIRHRHQHQLFGRQRRRDTLRGLLGTTADRRHQQRDARANFGRVVDSIYAF